MLFPWWLLSDVAYAGLIEHQTTLLDRFQSFLGVFVLAGIAWVLSENRKAVRWRPVAWGIVLQLVFGVIVLSPTVSHFFFTVVNTGVNQLLYFSGEGATFVFQSTEPHVIKVGTVPELLAGGGEEQLFVGTGNGMSPPVKTFAFWVLPTIIFFSSLMSVLYYLGIMQVIVRWIAKVMVVTLGTSGAESLSAAGNIFVGQTEAPLLIRPFVQNMTRSELMVVMTGGFATVSGGVLGAYVGFLHSIPNIAGHLVTASIISAPAALACAKLMVPETEESETAGTVHTKFEKNATNVMEAAATGATDGLTLAFNVAAMLIAIVALVAMFDWIIGFVPVTFCSDGGAAFGYTCMRDPASLGVDLSAVQAQLAAGQTVVVDQAHNISVIGANLDRGLVEITSDPLSLSRILGWIFAPIAFVMGVPWSECTVIGDLLGQKIVLTEFIAYINLGAVVDSPEIIISERSAVIASYALCGFANFASIGIQIGGIGGIAPKRISDLASLGFKGMICGVIAACMTGAIAGVML